MGRRVSKKVGEWDLLELMANLKITPHRPTDQLTGVTTSLVLEMLCVASKNRC